MRAFTQPLLALAIVMALAITVGAHRRLGLGVILDAQRKWFICT